ncbi:hypothetical protein ACPOLB_25270 [Rubrivivax sp. RP6-9]|uniref:hypothetical protein n=1 Tax=Rubrivivax sp. RP6-9 TaxID=3415750 RepID=UPI003CC6117C
MAPGRLGAPALTATAFALGAIAGGFGCLHVGFAAPRVPVSLLVVLALPAARPP